MPENDYVPVKSALRVIEILELLGGSSGDVKLGEIAARLALPKSSAHALLSTLRETGYVERRGGTGGYRLGLRLLSLAALARGAQPISERSRELLNDASRKTGLTSSLAVLDGLEVVSIECAEAQAAPVRVTVRPGARLPAHATASGKVLLGELSDAELSGLLDQIDWRSLTPLTITSPAGLKTEIARYRRDGFAIDDEEAFTEVASLAAPVRDAQGAVTAAVAFTGLASRLKHGRSEALAAELLSLASALSDVAATSI